MKNHISITRINEELVKDALYDLANSNDFENIKSIFGIELMQTSSDNILGEAVKKMYKQIQTKKLKELLNSETKVIHLTNHDHSKLIKQAFDLVNSFEALVLVDNDGEVIGIESDNNDEKYFDWARVILSPEEFSTLLNTK